MIRVTTESSESTVYDYYHAYYRDSIGLRDWEARVENYLNPAIEKKQIDEDTKCIPAEGQCRILDMGCRAGGTIEAVDFIYSNSFDHSYDSEKCLDAWMSCLKKGGICILEHSSGHIKSTRLDPFGADIIVMPYLITSWGKGKYGVREILDAPLKKDSLEYLKFIIIQKF